MLNKLSSGLVKFSWGFCLLAPLFFVIPHATAEVSEADLEENVNSLSAEVDDLARDISLLERELLFPPLTRVQIYLSLATDVQFTPRAMTLLVDGDEKSFHIYSDSDVAALRLGGLQRFWEGNVAMGIHQLSALIKGVDKKGRTVEEEIHFSFEKKNSGHSIEIKISAEKDSKKPSFSVKDWGES
ncbi:MAG: hypothetical protein HRU20_19895 [Pseudomonadales bacterium]|nr:hypothetical protein [Pseudomonadales bacterium]